MSRKLLLSLGVVAAGIIALLSAWVITRKSVEPTATTTIVRVAQTGDFLLYAGLYLASETGAFERRGLEVQITNTGGDEKSVAAVLAGQADFGVGDPTFAAIARERGQDIRVVASLVNGVPFWGITYSPQVVQRYHETGLRGLRVATFPAPSTAYSLQQDMFRTTGIEPKIVQGAFGSLLGILERGEADVALELEPNVSLAQQERGATVLYSLAERYGDFAITGVTVSGRYANENPQVVRAFCAALGDAYLFARRNPSEAARLLGLRFPELPAPVITQALRRMTQAKIIPETPVMAAESWRSALQLRSRVGDLRDVEGGMRVLDSSFARPAQ